MTAYPSQDTVAAAKKAIQQTLRDMDDGEIPIMVAFERIHELSSMDAGRIADELEAT